MQSDRFTQWSRREFLTAISALAASTTLGIPAARAADATGGAKEKIGIIGSGRVGGTVGELWANAGYRVMFSSLDLAQDKALAARVGHDAQAGTPAEAAPFGDILLISVPYSALPQIGRDHGASIRGKVVLDTSNPVAARDGDMATPAREKGAGVASAEYLPGARLVRA